MINLNKGVRQVIVSKQYYVGPDVRHNQSVVTPAKICQNTEHAVIFGRVTTNIWSNIVWSTSHIKIQWPDAVFKMPDVFQWIVVATGSKHLEDIYKVPDNVLSNLEAIGDVRSIFESCIDCSSTHSKFKLDIRSGPLFQKIHTIYH